MAKQGERLTRLVLTAGLIGGGIGCGDEGPAPPGLVVAAGLRDGFVPPIDSGRPPADTGTSDAGPGTDGGADDGGAITDDGGVPLPVACGSIDPDRVYLYGEVAAGLSALARPETPTRPCGALPFTFTMAAISPDSQVVYAVDDDLYALVPDELRFVSDRWTFGTSPFDDDVQIPTPACQDDPDGITRILFDTDGTVLYSCDPPTTPTSYFDSEGNPYTGFPEVGIPLAIASTGEKLTFTGSPATPFTLTQGDGTELTVDGGDLGFVTFVRAVRATTDGFWVSVNADRAAHVAFADGTISVLDFAALTAVAGTQRDAFDASGALYTVADALGGPVVYRRTPDGTVAELVYDGRDATGSPPPVRGALPITSP